jgi:phosphatidylethanolamine/phosphatidyl-N-methylethanolamine N-methyltransferase
LIDSNRGNEMDVTSVDRVYTRYAPIYDRVFGKVFQPSREALMSRLAAHPGTRVLEVGVGTGLLLPLYPASCEVTAVDLSAGMLEQAARRTRMLGLDHIRLARMDASRMAFPDDHFDVVLAAYVVTAVPDHRAVLEEMIRVCRPGGRVMVLNHFTNGNGLLAACERAVSSFCTRFGFRTDLSLDQVLAGTPLAVLYHERVKPLGMWHLVECRNLKAEWAVA